MKGRENQRLVDVSMPVAPGSVFRPGTPPVEIAMKQFYHESEAVQWLASSRINAVGIDAQDLARDPLHGEYDRLLAEHDVIVIENLANLAAVPRSEFTVYCFPLSIDGIDAIPARVLVGIEADR